MRILITAGPTREYIDDIRFITNGSSGLMGLALAEESAKRGHEVTLVLGPTSLTPMYGMKVIPAQSADEMTDRTLKELDQGYDALISAAAIGDYTPEKRVTGKLSSAKPLTLKLKPTRKLIREARKKHPKLLIVAFKAVYEKGASEMVEEAKKLKPYADMIVANDLSAGIFGSQETEISIVCEDEVKCVPRTSKKAAAKTIMDAVESRFLAHADA